MKAIYKVEMTFLAEKDNYDEGCTGELGAQWQESEEFATLKDVKRFVADRTYSGYEHIEYDSYLKRYTTSYTATDENVGEMSENERKQWQNGEINGWYVMCDITVQKYTPKLIGNIQFN